jgi:hypothetical protein
MAKTYTQKEMDEGFARGAKLRAEARRDLIERGKFFEPIKRPKGYRKRADKACFTNAALLACDGRGTYVEGLACSSSSPGLAVHHAWITLDGVHAIETTWQEPGASYFGVAFDDVKTVAHTLLHPNSWMGHAHFNLDSISEMPAVSS